jgi:hypothetical protein
MGKIVDFSGDNNMEKYEFTIMRYDEPVMYVSIDSNTVTTRALTSDDDKLPFYFKPDLDQIFTYIEDRCSERSRPDQQEILALIGLSEYNPYEIVKKTHGITPDDHFWFRFPGENLTWREVDGYKRF